MLKAKNILLVSLILLNIENSFSFFTSSDLWDEVWDIGDEKCDSIIKGCKGFFSASFSTSYGKLTNFIFGIKNEVFNKGKVLSECPANLINKQIEIIKPKAKNAINEIGSDLGLELVKQIDIVQPKAKNAINDISFAVRNQIFKLGLQSVSLTVFGLSAFYATKIMWDRLVRYLNSDKFPNIITDSFKFSYLDKIKNLIYGNKLVIKDMIFSPEITIKTDSIIKFTQVANKKILLGNTDIKYKSLLLSGTIGNGKAMFAKNLALKSGMDFIALSGSSLNLLPELEAINAINNIFNMANKFSGGLVIFIDNADCLLPQPQLVPYTNSKKYKAGLLNNFLSLIKNRSNRLMLILSTNKPSLLNVDIGNYIDESIELPSPGKVERENLLTLYIDKILLSNQFLSSEYKSSIKEMLNNIEIKRIVEETEGYSCLDLKNLIINIKTACHSSELSGFETSIIDNVLISTKNKHNLFALNL